MGQEDREFEQLNARIARLLEGQGATVQWNATLKDPDKPTEDRQIDVLITSADGSRRSVECRNRSGVQTVMWIEELAGRKLSLGLDGMIAVAINGFTPLARTKAARFGIALYDFDRLTDAEIASWGDVAQVESTFVQFEKLEILAGVPETAAAALGAATSDPAFLRDSLNGYVAVMDALRDEVVAHPGVERVGRIDATGFSVDGVALTVLAYRCIGHVVTAEASCAAVSRVDTAGTAREQRSVSVQHFDHTLAEIVLHADQAILQVDVDRLPVPPNAILHTMSVRFPRVTTVTDYELIGRRRLESPATTIVLEIVATT